MCIRVEQRTYMMIFLMKMGDSDKLPEKVKAVISDMYILKSRNLQYRIREYSMSGYTVAENSGIKCGGL